MHIISLLSWKKQKVFAVKFKVKMVDCFSFFDPCDRETWQSYKSTYVSEELFFSSSLKKKADISLFSDNNFRNQKKKKKKEMEASIKQVTHVNTEGER